MMKRMLALALTLALILCLSTAMAEAEKKTFRITLQFGDDFIKSDNIDRAAESLKLINQALSGLELSMVTIEGESTFLTSHTTYDEGRVDTVTHRYGFNELTLVCEQAAEEGLHQFQIDTEVDAEGVFTAEQYHDDWSERHPDRIMRRLTQHTDVTFGDIKLGSVFIVIHAER